MKIKKVIVICILAFILLFSLAACGADKNTSTEVEESVQDATGQEATVEQAIPTADTSESVDSLIGNWENIDSPDLFANITKVGTDYQYEDNDDKYTGTYADGILKVKVNDTEFADVYIDAKTGHMISVYQGSPAEFKKK